MLEFPFLNCFICMQRVGNFCVCENLALRNENQKLSNLKRAVRHRNCLIGSQQGQWRWHFEIPDWIGILGKKETTLTQLRKSRRKKPPCTEWWEKIAEIWWVPARQTCEGERAEVWSEQMLDVMTLLSGLLRSATLTNTMPDDWEIRCSRRLCESGKMPQKGGATSGPHSHFHCAFQRDTYCSFEQGGVSQLQTHSRIFFFLRLKLKIRCHLNTAWHFELLS